MKKSNLKTEKYLSDVNFHLDSLKLGIETLQLDHNNEKSIYLFCEKATNKLILIERLLNIKKLSRAIVIVTEVNKLFSHDKNLSRVNIQMINSKRTLNPYATANLKITI